MINDGTFSIGRVYSGDADFDQKIKITIKDTHSTSKFLTLYVDPAEFAMALTGASERKMQFELGDISNVGKTKESKSLIIELTLEELQKAEMYTSNIKALKEYITQHQIRWVDVGWIIDPRVNARNSVGITNTGITLNVMQYRYV